MSSISNTHPKHIFTKKKGFGYAPFGGLEGDRTLDLTDANRTLSHAVKIYAPKKRAENHHK